MSCLESSSSIMSILPTHIMLDIFSRLNVYSIGHCRCVCKEWCDLLSDPHFINLHLSKSPSYLMTNEYDQPVYVPALKLFKIDDEPNHHFVHREPSRTWQQRVSDYLYLQGSVNGLLCFWEFDKNDNTYIFNPASKEYVLLPKHKNVSKYYTCVSYGFGLSPITRQYKVLRIFQDNRSQDSPSECEVYTLGTNMWRSVGNVSFIIQDKPAVFMNGGFHWIKFENIPRMVARFDLETESFQMLCSTPTLALNRDGHCKSTLIELRGCLCICDNSLSSELVIWAMKEYGVKESWSKEIVISRNYIPDWVGYEAVSPVKILKDGSILMLWLEDCLFTYCPRTKYFEQLDLEMFDYATNYDVVNYVPSILSLKNIFSENVRVF